MMQTFNSESVGDQVFIEQLRVDCVIGVLPEERNKPQPLVIDVQFAINLQPAGASGDLQQTIDYSQVATAIRAVLVEEKFKLLETAAEHICTMLLAQYKTLPLTRIDLWIRKPEALRGVAVAGVKVTRCR